MIKIGGTDITDIAVGNASVEKAYIGNQLVWEMVCMLLKKM